MLGIFFSSGIELIILKALDTVFVTTLHSFGHMPLSSHTHKYTPSGAEVDQFQSKCALVTLVNCSL